MSAFFELIFEGYDADASVLDFYDVSQALIGFQRSLAITTHAVLNDEVITQAPSLKGARIVALPPQEGSWKIAAVVLAGGHIILQANAVPRETPLGNLIYSAYDYVVSESLGFHVDFKRTLGEQIEEYHLLHPDFKIPRQSRFDSVIEKSQAAIRDMHRPIVKSQTAERAQIFKRKDGAQTELLPGPLDAETFDYINFTNQGDDIEIIYGTISSYNMNTFSGRVYDNAEHRTISFDLSPAIKTRRASEIIAESMSKNITENNYIIGMIELSVFRRISRTGRTKSYHVMNVDRMKV